MLVLSEILRLLLWGVYIREKLEKSFNLGNGMGWVHFYKKNTSNYKRKWRLYFWAGLLTLNILVSSLFIIKQL